MDRADRLTRLWIAAGAALATVSLGGCPTSDAPEPAGRATRADAAAPGQEPAEARTCGDVEAARALRSEGKRAEAAALLDDAPPREDCAAPHAGLRARLYLDAGDNRAAARGLAAARAAALPHQVGQRARDGLALAYVLTLKTREFSAARELLAALDADTRESPGMAARVPYYAGLLALETGDLRAAVRRLGQASDRARKEAMTGLLLNAQQLTAETLMRLGRGAEALAALDALAAEAGHAPPDDETWTACHRARVFANLGWLRLLERERIGPTGPDPRPAIETSLTHYREGCSKPALIANAHVNLALDAAQRGEIDTVRAALEEARSAHPEPDGQTASWMADIAGRADRSAGRHDVAIATFQRLADDAPPGSDEQLRGLLGMAETLDRADRPAEAITAYQRVEAALEAAQASVPLGAGRDTFLSVYDRSTQRLIELQVEAGRPGPAMRTARRARARVLDGLVAQGRVARLAGKELSRWDEALARYHAARAEAASARRRLRVAPDDERVALRAALQAADKAALAAVDDALTALTWRPATALGRPAEGTALLAWYPVRRGDVMGFAAAGADVKAARIEALAMERAGAAALLAPFDDVIAAAHRLDLMPAGRTRSLDLHAATWRGAPLVAHAPVAYRLDLPPRGPSTPLARRALVVSDPGGDLPGARADGTAVAARLTGVAEAPVTHLSQRQATEGAVRGALRQATQVHWSGHATFGGVGGWGSELDLAGDAHLGPADILALPRVPQRVVLLACESGRAAPGTAETVGIAQAFLVAGAHQVIATSRPIEDRQASRLSDSLYGGATTDLPASLRRAQLAVAASCANCDWAAFRALVP